MNWITEVETLHDFFAAWFAGTAESLERLEIALDPAFTIVGPDGVERSRAEIVDQIAAGEGRNSGVHISTADHALLSESRDVLVARYRELHHSGAGSTSRISTVVFRRDTDAPNGVVWLRVHETWEPEPS